MKAKKTDPVELLKRMAKSLRERAKRIDDTAYHASYEVDADEEECAEARGYAEAFTDAAIEIDALAKKLSRKPRGKK